MTINEASFACSVPASSREDVSMAPKLHTARKISTLRVKRTSKTKTCSCLDLLRAPFQVNNEATGSKCPVWKRAGRLSPEGDHSRPSAGGQPGHV